MLFKIDHGHFHFSLYLALSLALALTHLQTHTYTPVGEERRGANLRDRFRQRLSAFAPMQWFLHTQQQAAAAVAYHPVSLDGHTQTYKLIRHTHAQIKTLNRCM